LNQTLAVVPSDDDGPTRPLALPAPDEHLTSPATRSILRIQQSVVAALRARLMSLGFIELLPPLVGPVTDPGVRGSKQVDIDYYGHTYKLMTSAILYKQVSLHAFDRIFFVAPNIRLEPPQTLETSRHLVEFHQLDVEWAGATYDDVMDLLEDIVVHCLQRVAEDCATELQSLGRALPIPARPFGRRLHRDVIAEIKSHGGIQHDEAEISWREEAVLSRDSVGPFFIRDYPKGSRGFYDREDSRTPGVLRDFDLLMPEGFGEVASGGEREHTYERLVTRMRETGENPAKYGWYLDVARRSGIPASAGFGLGVERLTRFIAGVDEIWRVHPYPKLPGMLAP